MKEVKSTRSNNQHNNMASNYMPTTHYNTPHRHTQNQYIVVDIPHATSHIIKPTSIYTTSHQPTLHRTRNNNQCPLNYWSHTRSNSDTKNAPWHMYLQTLPYLYTSSNNLCIQESNLHQYTPTTKNKLTAILPNIYAQKSTKPTKHQQIR